MFRKVEKVSGRSVMLGSWLLCKCIKFSVIIRYVCSTISFKLLKNGDRTKTNIQFGIKHQVLQMVGTGEVQTTDRNAVKLNFIVIVFSLTRTQSH